MRKNKIVKILILIICIIGIIVNTKIFATEEEPNESKLQAKEGQYVYTIDDSYLIHREGCYENIDTSLDRTHKYKIFQNLGTKASSNDSTMLAGKSKLIFMSNKNAIYGKLKLTEHTKTSIKEVGTENTQWARVRVDVAGGDKKETDVGYAWKTGLIDNSNLIFVYTVEQQTDLYFYDKAKNKYVIDSTQIANPGDEYRINKLENNYIKIEKIENGKLTGKTAYIQNEKLVRKMFNWNDNIPDEYNFTKSNNVIDNMLAIAYYVRTLHPQYALLTPASYIDGILSFNCSGFVQFVMKYAGIDIQKFESANEMYNSLKDNELWDQKREITYNNKTLNMPLKTSQNNKDFYKTHGSTVINNLQKGDILYFKTAMDYSEVTHIGIYVEDGMFIHSSGDSGVICTSLLDWLNGDENRDLMGYSRYINPKLSYEKDFSDIQKYKTYSDMVIDARIMYDENVKNNFIKVKATKYKNEIDYTKSKAILNNNSEDIGVDSEEWENNYESYNMSEQTFYFNDKKDSKMYYLHLLLNKSNNIKEEIVIGPIIFEVDEDKKSENTNIYEVGEVVAIMKDTTIIDVKSKTEEKIENTKLMEYLGESGQKIVLKDLATNNKYLVNKSDIKNVYQSKSSTAYLRSTPEVPKDNSNLITQLDNGEIVVEINKQDSNFNKYYISNGKNYGKIGYLSDSISKTKIVKEIEVERLKIKSLPNKIIYNKNEKLDIAGGVITAYFENGDTTDIKMSDSNVEISGFDSSVSGKRTITVKYKEKSVTFDITIKNIENNTGNGKDDTKDDNIDNGKDDAKDDNIDNGKDDAKDDNIDNGKDNIKDDNANNGKDDAKDNNRSETNNLSNIKKLSNNETNSVQVDKKLPFTGNKFKYEVVMLILIINVVIAIIKLKKYKGI